MPNREMTAACMCRATSSARHLPHVAITSALYLQRWPHVCLPHARQVYSVFTRARMHLTQCLGLSLAITPPPKCAGRCGHRAQPRQPFGQPQTRTRSTHLDRCARGPSRQDRTPASPSRQRSQRLRTRGNRSRAASGSRWHVSLGTSSLATPRKAGPKQRALDCANQATDCTHERLHTTVTVLPNAWLLSARLCAPASGLTRITRVISPRT